MQHLVPCSVISKRMSENIAKSGLSYQNTISLQKNGEDGIKVLFSERFNGSVRIKKSKKIISSADQHFKG